MFQVYAAFSLKSIYLINFFLFCLTVTLGSVYVSYLKIGNNFEFSGSRKFMSGLQNLDFSLPGLTDRRRLFWRMEVKILNIPSCKIVT